MSNQERRNTEENVHMILGFMRKKFNGDVRPRCIRRILKTEKDFEIMKAELQIIGGNWRIHRTVNRRSTKKAFKNIQHYMIENPNCYTYLDSVWKTILLRPECRADKLFMLDVDSEDQEIISKIRIALAVKSIPLISEHKTPNGWHLIYEPFDVRFLDGFEKVTILKDGYVYIDSVYDNTHAPNK